jgi:DNA-binding NarL/FixJ family response regulator
MKTINVTFISSQNTARLECASVVKHNPDIDLVAVTSSPNQRGIWTALSRSDVVVIDDENVRHDGDESLVMLLACNPGVRFLVIMESFDENRILRAITQGVRGVIFRGELRQLLVKAIRQVHEGEVWMPRNLLNSFREMINPQRACHIGMDSNAANARSRLH